MENEKVIAGKNRSKKRKRIGKKVGNVVAIIQAVSVIITAIVCIQMYSSLVESMQKKICVNGTNLLAYELSRVSGDDDLNEVLDSLKARQGCEFTIFEGDTRTYSTVMQNGERVVGTKLSSELTEIVLNKKQSYVGKAEILGEPYLCSYVPTRDADGQVNGLIFAGISIADAERETTAIINYVIIAGLAMILVCILFLTAYLKMSVSAPLKKITHAAERLKKGELGLADGSRVQIGVSSNDEIGLLGELFEDTMNSLRAYIGEIDDILGSIAKGDLTQETRQNYTGDFLAIKKSLDSILNALNHTMGQISVSAESVSNGSDQVSASAQSLAQGATEQASAVTEISTTISNISANAKETSAAAEEAGQITNQAGAQLGISMENVKELSLSMERIASDSKKIGTIIATIENIAFQINILSLNATVEAARAGEAGKGFSVVAEEISSLASKSDEAAKATKELIESSAATIKEGSRVMDKVSEALKRTGELAGNVTVKMEQMVEAVESQTLAMEQVATGVEQISAVVESNSATSQECAAASEEMSSQSSMLKRLISSFRLKGSRW